MKNVCVEKKMEATAPIKLNSESPSVILKSTLDVYPSPF